MILRYLLPIGISFIIHRGLAKLYLFIPFAIRFSFKYFLKNMCVIKSRPAPGSFQVLLVTLQMRSGEVMQDCKVMQGDARWWQCSHHRLDSANMLQCAGNPGPGDTDLLLPHYPAKYHCTLSASHQPGKEQWK